MKQIKIWLEIGRLKKQLKLSQWHMATIDWKKDSAHYFYQHTKNNITELKKRIKLLRGC